jgi:outer membrane protein assembly factor BamD
VTRDQDLSKKAIDAMNTVVTKYPSPNTSRTPEEDQMATDQIAGKEMQVGRYYLERREYLAA